MENEVMIGQASNSGVHAMDMICRGSCESHTMSWCLRAPAQSSRRRELDSIYQRSEDTIVGRIYWVFRSLETMARGWSSNNSHGMSGSDSNCFTIITSLVSFGTIILRECRDAILPEELEIFS
jgi:hypothetical protein